MTEETKNELLFYLLKEFPHFSKKSIEKVCLLYESGNTIPFIARYRKEMTGNLDEVELLRIIQRKEYLEKLMKRKEEITHLIKEQGKWTIQLKEKIKQSTQLTELEDLYLPYKQKRRTKATIAKEKGYMPLAQAILDENEKEMRILLQRFKKKEAFTTEEIIQGAIEILAEKIAENASFRKVIRHKTHKKSTYSTRVKDKEKDVKGVYTLYYDFNEPFIDMAAHRVLATNRGEKEGILTVSIKAPEKEILAYLTKECIHFSNRKTASYLNEAILKSYKRFIKPSIEREIRKELTEKAQTQAIHVFGENLNHLLLQPVLKEKVVMGFDPAYRTGCKLAILDALGNVVNISVIYPHKPASEKKQAQAKKEFIQLVNDYQVERIAIGNGTASRESEEFVANCLKEIDHVVYYVIVSEAGASVYSASKEAREEFPELQVEQRSAISIGRRIQDPLAELVKVDPQALGIGQYQHDVSQKQLKEQLTFVVETVVNRVGVNLNTASSALLQFVSGLNKTIAENIITYRQENGPFMCRKHLKNVPRLGPKAYEQAAGFLRIFNGKNVLDQTGIHPESYDQTKQLLTLCQIDMNQLKEKEGKDILRHIDQEKMSKTLKIGKETLKDIIDQLLKPGRDIREELPQPLLRKDILKISDLKPGMQVEGTIRNVVDFGAFVDIGVKQDGFIHLSKLTKRFLNHPSSVVQVGQIVKVWIDSIDEQRGRIGLTMIDPIQK